jgi:hypothetical protein
MLLGKSREHEALRRFYAFGQDAAQILADLDMDESEFNKLRSRMKGQYRERHQGKAS